MSEQNPVSIFYIVAGVVILAIFAVIFSLQYLVDDTPVVQKVEYNYFTFYNVSGFWDVDIKLGEQVYRGTFRFNPLELENVSINGSLSKSFNTPPVFITFDPTSNPDSFKYQALAVTELSLNLVRALNVSVEGACTKNETDACVDRPIVSCDTLNASVIYIVPEGEPKIVLNNRCVTLYGSEFGLVKSADRLIYQWYKIMK